VLYSIREVEECAADNDEVYYDKEVICQTLEGRNVPMITFSSREAVKEEKPVVFLTARVHCGETPGSYMLQGIIDKLRDLKDKQT